MSAREARVEESSTEVRWQPTKYRAELGSTGETFEFVASARTAADGRFRFVWTLAAGKRGPGEHVHDEETEVFEVQSGTLRIWLHDVPHDLGPGDSLTVPPGAPHRFLNPTREPAVVRVTFDGPRMEDTFLPISVATHGRTPRLGDFARMLVGIPRYRSSTPASAAERAVLGALAWVLGLFVRPYEPVAGWDAERT